MHHPNELVRLLLHVKLASANSVFAENCCYLSFKYQITRENWNKPYSFLLGKVKLKNPLHVQSTCQTIVELYNIRDGLSFCDGLNYSNIICILNAYFWTLLLYTLWTCLYVWINNFWFDLKNMWTPWDRRPETRKKCRTDRPSHLAGPIVPHTFGYYVPT